MKMAEAIERLKKGDMLRYDNDFRYPTATFQSDNADLGFDTAFKIRHGGSVSVEPSKTAHGVEYITWLSIDGLVSDLLK